MPESFIYASWCARKARKREPFVYSASKNPAVRGPYDEQVAVAALPLLERDHELEAFQLLHHAARVAS